MDMRKNELWVVHFTFLNKRYATSFCTYLWRFMYPMLTFCNVEASQDSLLLRFFNNFFSASPLNRSTAPLSSLSHWDVLIELLENINRAKQPARTKFCMKHTCHSAIIHTYSHIQLHKRISAALNGKWQVARRSFASLECRKQVNV